MLRMLNAVCPDGARWTDFIAGVIVPVAVSRETGA